MRRPERVDEATLLDGRVRLRQPVDGYRTAIDPVILAAAVPARAGETVLDLGCGAGPAALCLLARIEGAHAVGLEHQAGMAVLARENAALNAAADRFRVVRGDVERPPWRNGTFEHVMANPPHHRAGHGRAPGSAGRAAGNVEGVAKLPVWVTAMLTLVRPRGTLALIHRADRMDEILRALPATAGAVTITPLWPAPAKPAGRVLIQARRDVRTAARLAPGLVLHEPDGGYTPDAEAVLRHARGLGM